MPRKSDMLILQHLCMCAVEEAPERGILAFLRRLWFGCERKYRLMVDCIVEFGGITYIAREGMIFDGASIPRPLWALFGSPFTGPQRYAAVIHDAAYGNTLRRKVGRQLLLSRRSRARADRVMRQMLRARGATRFTAWTMWLFVRLFGGRRYAKAD